MTKRRNQTIAFSSDKILQQCKKVCRLAGEDRREHKIRASIPPSPSGT